ncbi:MAG: hypothetical protein ACXIVL_02345 [Oceanicaulis sp.]
MFRLLTTSLLSASSFLTACNLEDARERTEPAIEASVANSEAASNDSAVSSEAASSVDNYQADYPLNAFNEAFETRFFWENRGRERMVSEDYRSGSIWVPSKLAGEGLSAELIRALLPSLNNGPFAETPVSGCSELLMLSQSFFEDSPFTTAAVNCGRHNGVVTAFANGEYIQVWLVTGRETPLTREQAFNRSTRLALALQQRIVGEF